MRVRYRLPVLGRLRIDTSFPVTTKLFTYHLETDGIGHVTHIAATAAVSDPRLWPRVTPLKQPGPKFQLEMSSPWFDELRRELRAASGMLAMYGVEEVGLELVEETWEPETEEEKGALPLTSFQVEKKPPPVSDLTPMPFDLVARALIVADQAGGVDAALNFFRMGRVDVRAEQYLDAVLDYLFMIETTYANGKFRTAQVEAEYLSSKELLKLISETLTNQSLLAELRADSRIHKLFIQTYEGKAPEEIIPYIVSLRGELHHHSGRKNGIWHPTDHMRFAADAYFLEYLCLKIAFSITHDTLFGETAISEYQRQARQSTATGTIQHHRRDA